MNWKHHVGSEKFWMTFFFFNTLTEQLIKRWCGNRQIIILVSFILSCDYDFPSACFNISTGQRCRQVSETWSHRGMCNKPQEAKAEPPSTAPAHGRVLNSHTCRTQTNSITDINHHVFKWKQKLAQSGARFPHKYIIDHLFFLGTNINTRIKHPKNDCCGFCTSPECLLLLTACESF